MKAMDMKSRIELELRGKDASTIKELNLDNCRGQHIDGLTDDFQNLEILSLINVGLTNLKGFPKLPNLRKLELSENRISNGIENLLGCPNLTHLNLSNNRLRDFEVLLPLAKLDKLTNLDLFNCEVTQAEEYRDKIFKLIPSLRYLDGFDKNEQEEEEFDADEEDDDEDGEDDEEEEDGDDDDEEEEDDEGEDGVEEEEDEEAHIPKKGAKIGLPNGLDKNKVKKQDAEEDQENEAEDENDDGENEEDDGDEDDEDEDDEGDDDEEDNEVGLSYLQKSNLQDEEDDADFDAKAVPENASEEDDDDDDDEEEEEDDEDDDDEDEEDEDQRATMKRKREEDDEESTQ